MSLISLSSPSGTTSSAGSVKSVKADQADQVIIMAQSRLKSSDVFKTIFLKTEKTNLVVKAKIWIGRGLRIPCIKNLCFL